MAQRDKDPAWWTSDDSSTWERVKEALRRDWEQTKHDLSTKRGKDLDQDVDDTLRQAAGKQRIPGPNTPNPPDTSKHSSTPSRPLTARTIRDDDWARSEDAVRYGFGAAGHYRSREWDQKLEGDLKKEWTGLAGDERWDDVKESVRRGWNGRRQSKEPPR